MTRTIRTVLARVLLGSTAFTPLLVPSLSQAQEARPANNEVPAAKKKTTKELHQLLLNSSGWIIWQPTETTTSSGTGWIIDKERKLMITNDHVVEGTDVLQVIFPIFKDGRVVREEGEYSIKNSVKGTVIDRDAVRDLAIIQLESLPENAIALTLATGEPEEGDIVRTIGGQTNGSDGFVWGNVSGEVRTVGINKGLNRLGNVRSVMTTAPINGGNSGGPLINEAGELVAVNSYYTTAGNSGRAVNGVVSGHVSVIEVQKYLKETAEILAPKTAEQWTKRGERKLNSSRTDAAAKDFAKAIDIDETFAKAYYLRARCFLEKNDARTALEDLNEAIKLDGSAYDFRVYRGVAHRTLGNIEEAMKDFSSAIRKDPSKGTGYNQRGLTYEAEKKYDEAMEDMTRAIERDDQNAKFYADRGDLAYVMKKYDIAVKDFTQAAKLAPWKPDYILALGNCLMLSGKNMEAAEIFVEGANRTNNNPVFLIRAGDALRMAKDYKQAEKFYNDALKGLGEKAKTSQLISAHVGRGLCLVELKQYKNAIDDFTKVIDLTEGKNGEAYALRGEAHQANGSENLAADDFAAAKKLGWKSESGEKTGEKTAKKPEPAKKKSSPFVGTWKMSTFAVGLKIRQTITFTDDGKFECESTISNEFGIETTDSNGTWKVEQGKLILRSKQAGTVVRDFETVGEDEINIEMDELGKTVTFSRSK